MKYVDIDGKNKLGWMNGSTHGSMLESWINTWIHGWRDEYMILVN